MADELSLRQILHENSRVVGELMLEDGIPVILESLLWGVYAVAAVHTTYHIYRRGLDSRPRLALFVTTIVLFATSTVLLLLDIVSFVDHVNAFLLDTSAMSEEIVFVETHLDKISFIVYYLLLALAYLVGDVVVIWRAWVLWPGQQYVLFGPLILWLAALATVIAGSICRTQAKDFFTNPIADSVTCERLQISSTGISLAANGAATVLIAYKAWRHRQVIKASFGNTASRTRVERILGLLVESGFIYLVLWGAQSVSLFDVDGLVANIIVFCMLYLRNQFVGLYPTVIILIVEHKRSIWDAAEVSSALASSMHFASRQRPAVSQSVDTHHQPSAIQFNNSTIESADMDLPPDEPARDKEVSLA